MFGFFLGAASAYACDLSFETPDAIARFVVSTSYWRDSCRRRTPCIIRIKRSRKPKILKELQRAPSYLDQEQEFQDWFQYSSRSIWFPFPTHFQQMRSESWVQVVSSGACSSFMLSILKSMRLCGSECFDLPVN